jgi:hemerythrin superfamily protein
MNAIDIIKNDHKVVRDLFSQFQSSTEDDLDRREDLFQDIEKELLIHTEIEEQIFYPALTQEVPSVIEEAIQEHNQMKTTLSELLEYEVDDDEFENRMNTLFQLVEDHLQEEEGPNGILEIARERFDSARLDDMGRRMEEMKRSSEDEIAA